MCFYFVLLTRCVVIGSEFCGYYWFLEDQLVLFLGVAAISFRVCGYFWICDDLFVL